VIPHMPDPQKLKVGDLVRFIAIPSEWSRPGWSTHPESVRFMRKMIRRTWPSRVFRIDEYGTPWVRAETIERGKRHYHEWNILESTGWRRVKRRLRPED